MMRVLRQSAKALRGLLALCALMFALTPSLEAANCAGEGFGPASSDLVASVDSVSPSDSSSNCGDDVCICAVCQCSHGVSFPATIAITDAPRAIERGPFGNGERLTSIASATLERPPRA